MSETLQLLLTWAGVLLAAVLYAGVAAGSNAYQIGRDYDVSHTWETRERAVVLGFFAGLAFHRHPGGWWLGPLAFAAAALLFGLWFDVRLNRRRGLAWDYVGTDPATAALDKAVRRWRLSGPAYAAAKAAGVLLLSLTALLLSGCAVSRNTPPAENIFDRPPGPSANADSAWVRKHTRKPTAAEVANWPKSKQRQYRKNLRAQPRQVPLVQGRGAVVAPRAEQVVTAYKPAAPVVLAADSAAVQVASSRKGLAVAGNGNTVTPPAAKPWWHGLVPWALGLAGAAVLWWVWPWLALLRRRRGSE